MTPDYSGAAVASLTVPFGQSRQGEDTGGYHLVWPRDLAESTGGLLAAGSHERAIPALRFFEATQEPDGHWSQNMWLNGEPHWNGIQMDETALVILLLNLARREGAVDKNQANQFWPMIRKAAAYLVCNGPATEQGRWEHDGGYSPFTIAAEIAALLSAADLAKENGESEIAHYLRDTADLWNAEIEAKTYVTNTDLARRLGVEGYYVRMAPAKDGGSKKAGSKSQNHTVESSICPDALALVRFGFRAPDDPRILNTVKAIDEMLKVDLGYGEGWKRYLGDKYGEYPDGRPFDNKGGEGRVWPLFAGERGHYELAAGRPDEAARLLRLMESSATATGLISEQVWDAEDIPEKGLIRGRPTTSACPLVWAHAEYIKLLRSLRDGKIFDRPEQTLRRYAKGHHRPRMQVRRFENPVSELCIGNKLRIEAKAKATIRWSLDGWEKTSETATKDTGLGIHYADLATEHMPAGSTVIFTFHWTEADRWEGSDFRVSVGRTCGC